MRLEWLEDILAVAETGSLSEAAERRNLTQSAFSRRVQAIEEYVGVPLFDRARKPLQLQPTTAQQRERIVALADDLRRLVVDLQQGSRATENRVVFASQHSLTTSLTPDLLRWLGTAAPDVYVRLRSANLDECFGLVLSRQADLAFVYRQSGGQHLIDADFIETLILGQDRLIPVFAADQADLLNAEFQKGALPVIVYPSDVFLGQVTEAAVLPGLRRLVAVQPKVETALTHAALELAKTGVGVAWVPSSVARTALGDGKLIDLSRTLPGVTLDVTAIRLAGRDKPARALIWDHLRRIAE